MVDLGKGHEFVATETRHHVHPAGHGGQPVGHLVEDAVARRMVRPVVDQLEAVEVDEQDGQ